MPARNKKSVLRTMRIPHDLDDKIRTLCAGRQRCYSSCLLALVRTAISDETRRHEMAGEKAADSVLQWVKKG
ncbi:hypothetical protein IQ454_002335 [Salmonella enterica]|nr:hypothetical protein [Salmonella enterica]EGL4358713.1 hypothetical protein [Salmonella enterica]EGL4381866.1 hypothetical protein [Salmonella enterica]EGL4485845.1 hypothetical protein [Salmonella enterica]EGL4514517.1 hypothetical protein [Salmonella enterica]